MFSNREINILLELMDVRGGYDPHIWETLSTFENYTWNREPETGNEMCMVALELNKTDPVKSFDLLFKADRQGSHVATCWIGKIFDYRIAHHWNVPDYHATNMRKAEAFYLKSIKNGNWEAKYELSRLYLDKESNVEFDSSFEIDPWDTLSELAFIGYSNAATALACWYKGRDKYQKALIYRCLSAGSISGDKDGNKRLMICELLNNINFNRDIRIEMLENIARECNSIGARFELAMEVPNLNNEKIEKFEAIIADPKCTNFYRAKCYEKLAVLYKDHEKQAESLKAINEHKKLLDLYKSSNISYVWVQHLNADPKPEHYTIALDAVKTGKVKVDVLKKIPGHIVYEYFAANTQR